MKENALEQYKKRRKEVRWYIWREGKRLGQRTAGHSWITKKVLCCIALPSSIAETREYF